MMDEHSSVKPATDEQINEWRAVQTVAPERLKPWEIMVWKLLLAYDEQKARADAAEKRIAELEALTDVEGFRRAASGWAQSRWDAEVKNRPLQNVYRRTLSNTWNQVIRHFGGEARDD